MIKAVFFDIDGTLVSFHPHRVSEATRQAIRQLSIYSYRAAFTSN